MKLTPMTEKFMLHWSEMGNKWGINRTLPQTFHQSAESDFKTWGNDSKIFKIIRIISHDKKWLMDVF